MAVDVTAFSAMARTEFMEGMLETQSRIMPAAFDSFVTTLKSTTRVDTHTYMSQIPRLREFRGYTPFSRLVSTPWTVPNLPYRVGVSVGKDDLADDQVAGYLKAINYLPQQAQKDIGYKILSTFAAGTTGLCFDGTAMFANSHTFGTGDNLLTADNSGNDGLTHKIIAVITDSPLKPMLFQDREPLSGLLTDADTPAADLVKEYQYWVDCRYGVACSSWMSAVHVTITDTPDLTELDTQLTNICNQFRTFTLPKGADVDDSLYVHEGWVPEASNFLILCNMGLAQLLDKLRTTDLVASGTSGATVNNQYMNKFSLIPTSALN